VFERDRLKGTRCTPSNPNPQQYAVYRGFRPSAASAGGVSTTPTAWSCTFVTPGSAAPTPVKLHADKGYDFSGCRRALRCRGICPRIARRGVESSQRLGRHRWKVERSLAWLLANRRLTVRYERRADLLQAFLHLACALICARKLTPLSK
jgi:IS5 family transposase